jgi:hypothetical protein
MPEPEVLVLDLDAALQLLSDEEREEYERCKQSVVDARRSAVIHEGQLVIG